MDLSVEEPPATPPASEILQASTPVTVEITSVKKYNSSFHYHLLTDGLVCVMLELGSK